MPHDAEDWTESWRFSQLGEVRLERFVVLDDADSPVAIWLDHHRLVNGNAYRLDYFKVRPDKQGRGLGQFVLGLIGLRASELLAERIVFQSLPNSEGFYRAKVGATPCDDWKGGGRLLNLQIDAEALTRLVEQLNGYRIER